MIQALHRRRTARAVPSRTIVQRGWVAREGKNISIVIIMIITTGTAVLGLRMGMVVERERKGGEGEVQMLMRERRKAQRTQSRSLEKEIASSLPRTLVPIVVETFTSSCRHLQLDVPHSCGMSPLPQHADKLPLEAKVIRVALLVGEIYSRRSIFSITLERVGHTR